ncbi:MAG: helix-turn-helix domain-containing protein [Candidatus Brocadiaceae bacterium]|nr:helix-turn-helix domain-containing protein [Candidatus Brocadiaceae bacterium]
MDDVFGLINKRRGQIKNYQMSPEVETLFIQQFAAHAVTGKSTSSIVLAQELNKESEVNISDRTVRVHTKKLGLATIAKSLPKLVATLKKLLSIAQAGVNGLHSSVSSSIPVHRSTNCRNIWRAQIIPLHNSGIKKPVIAKFTGCALSTVYRWISRRVERSLDDKT